MIRQCIAALLDNRDLTAEEAGGAMKEIMSGEATPAQIGAFLVGLKKKPETVEELTAFAKVMRDCSRKIQPKVENYLLDTCGTGGDPTKTFNVSTTTAFIIAAAGVPVAKHGNRSYTSKCGSADVLEQLGLNLNMNPETVEKSIEELGIGFMFAPNFHPAMRTVSPVRKEIGVPTIFNILGPLTNPAGANAQLLGVYDLYLLEPMAQTASNLGVKSVITVHGLDGVDEISLTGKTATFRIEQGTTTIEEIEPEDFGLDKVRPEQIAGSDPNENAQLTSRILSGKMPLNHPAVQTVIANAAMGLVITEEAEDLREGVEIASNVISDGEGFKKLYALIEFSGGNMHRLNSFA